MNAELKKSMKAAGNEARYDAYAKRLLSEKIVLAYILVKVVDKFRGMKPQDVVRYIEGDVRISDVPLDPGLTNISAEIQEKAGDVAEEIFLSGDLGSIKCRGCSECGNPYCRIEYHLPGIK